MSIKHWIVPLVIVAGMAARTGAQPSTAPATAPATLPARYIVTPPPGFIPIEVNGIRFLAEPPDEPIVRAALKDLAPATMPSTRPADILQKLASTREQLSQRIATDLALTDPAPVGTFLDTLQKALVTHRDLQPPLIFLVTTENKLKDLLKAGWTDPRFHYNRAADRVEVNWNLNIAMDRTPDESLVPAIYAPEDSPEQRQAKTAEAVRAMQERFAEYVAAHAADVCHNAFMDFLLARTLEPVKNKLDREWIAAGISGVLTCRYSSTLTQRNPDEMLAQLSSERPDLPLRQTAVDLIHPIDPSHMRPGAAPLYMIVYTRKAIRVCNELIATAGDSAIPKILADIRQNPPENGTALLEQIKRVSGVDLAANVAAGR